ncbi:patatin-like phospholipase [Colletotrichum graminicola]|uniref:Patatin-like phospholipase domain-containing protein n=1 Tax=Colletotrichum graminicola (strain M1.001 / M2 / FGSC 10212) TaxID=645133 RepID=E3QM42_COLGM|nr:patatin-like phospholipase [Colletotrichum graminicola M1.001]EFQ31930.1 patatin-like phospholipase [Colletotrichum graminicola M1.001]WDK21812.1 patatin-like phospholipase [Colletotrichum graminicola]
MNDVLLNSVHSHPAIRVKPSSTVPSASLKSVRPSSFKKQQLQQPQPPLTAALDTISRAVKSANNLVLSLRDGLTELERESRRKKEERRLVLALRMKNAQTRKQWQDAAEELDILEENDMWKLDPYTGDYNPALIEARLEELDDARINCDTRAMMHLVRTSLSRDLGGMENVDLYRHSYVGTKNLIERYVDSAMQTIDALVEKSQFALPEGMGQRDILESVLHARQSFGRSALLLSGGGTLGMSHIGVLKALFEVKLLPRIISGASAGSIVSAVICTRTDEEIPRLVKEFPYGDLAVFDAEENPDGVFDHMRRLLTEGSWSDIKHLTRVMRGLVGDLTFQEAYNRTRRVLNICVSTESMYELPRLLNYITAPNVMIWSAVAASCSVPLVFSAAPLLVKNPDTGEHMPWNPTPQRWIDGSVDNDLPMTRLAEMFNVNHFIVSQVNPHVVPFLARDDQLDPDDTAARRSSLPHSKQDPDWVYTLTSLAKEEALHRLHFLAEIGFFPNLVTKLRSILSQKYSGDINILPEVNVHDIPKILSNPSPDFMLRACLMGERATWPKLSRIRDRCAIELALDRAVHRLRARVVFSDSQVDLRRLTTGIVLPPPWPKSSASTKQMSKDAPALTLDSEVFKNRQRRCSGSSVQLMAHHRRLMENVLTDEETEEEERLEMRARHGHGSASPVVVRKPRLKRAAKSHYNVSMVKGLMTSPINSMQLEAVEFDFGKPVTPPLQRSRHSEGSLAQSRSPTYLDMTPAKEVDVAVPGSRGEATSHTETSDLHSSDGDVESHTEDTFSDPDPYERDWLHDGANELETTPKSGKDLLEVSSRELVPVGESRGGLWD